MTEGWERGEDSFLREVKEHFSEVSQTLGGLSFILALLCFSAKA
jgi:hypothetical protein